MNAEFPMRLPRMLGEEIEYQHYTGGLLSFIRENTFTLKGNGELPDWLKPILSKWSEPKVGDEFFYHGVWYEITKDGCKEVAE